MRRGPYVGILIAVLISAVGTRAGATERAGEMLVRLATAGIDADALLQRHGCLEIASFRSLPAVGARCPSAALLGLSREPGVVAVELSRPVVWHSLSDALTTTRWRDLNGGQTDLWSADDLQPNGDRVGVAVIDTGVSRHADMPPDLAGHVPGVPAGYQPRDASSVVYENWTVGQRPDYAGVPPASGNLRTRHWNPDSDQASGHGTHVAGLIAGRPSRVALQTDRLSGSDPVGTADDMIWIDPSTASVRTDPAQHGFAPGVKLFAYAAGASATMLTMASAFDWLLYDLLHPRPGDPPIRLVSNSWGTAGDSLNPFGVLTILIGQVIDHGVTVVFSAGNNGGSGTTATTNATCRIPRVVCVAAYDDSGVTDRSQVRNATFSSVGAITDPTTYPDIAGPGVRIRSTLPNDSYGGLSGTSVAAPIVAACIALAHDAYLDKASRQQPYLSPVQIESMIWSTAYRYPAAGNYISHPDPRHNGSNFRAGHGAIDCRALVDLARATP